MNKHLASTLTFLTQHKYLLTAFSLAIVIRSIPEALSWPYPLGVDNPNIIPLIRDNWAFSSGITAFFQRTSLFYVVAAGFNGVLSDPVITIKVLGPLLLGILAAVMFLFARKGLGWSNRKALLVAILVSTYFVSLRISWDLYRQTFGLIFLMATLITLKTFKSPRKYYIAGAFVLLTVLSHELITVIMFFILGLEAITYLLKRSRKDFLYVLAVLALPVALFYFQRYSFTAGTVIVPTVNVALEPSFGLTIQVFELFIYSYALLLPVVLLGLRGLKDSSLRYWAILCVGLPLLTIIAPSMSLSYWNRWVYLLVYPLLFFAANGFDKLWNLSFKLKNKLVRYTPKIGAIALFLCILVLSSFYLTTTPENASPFFSTYNPSISYIPSSMLQNTISISDNPSLVNCLNWLSDNTNPNSSIIVHYSFLDLLKIYAPNRHLIPVGLETYTLISPHNETIFADSMVEAAKQASAGGNNSVYTVWWSSGSGWYGIQSLPMQFKAIHQDGRIAIYIFDQNS